MAKHLPIFVFLLIFLTPLAGQDNMEPVIEQAEQFSQQGEHDKALALLVKSSQSSPPRLRIAWRIAREAFQLSGQTANKKQKIAYYDLAIKSVVPWLEQQSGAKRDRAELIHWYAINYASKIKQQGIFSGKESLTIVPRVFELMEKCIEVDAGYAGAYFFLGIFYSELPFFLGGDRIKMEINFNQALQNATEKEKILFQVEIARRFLKRNWSRSKKQKLVRKNQALSLPLGLQHDRELAGQLLTSVKNSYESKEQPTYYETEKYRQALTLLKQLN